MTLGMDLQATPGGSYTSLDMEALGIAQIKLSVSYDTPAKLTFVMYQAQHTIPSPLGIERFLRFWDDAAVDQDGGAFSSGNPIFEGYIDDISPGSDTNLVVVTCNDPTYKANKEIPVMSTAWLAGTPPTAGIGAVPRFIANCPLTGDTDFIFNQDSGLTTGNIMARLLDDALLMLRYYNAAPAATPSYDAADLNSFLYVTQDKVVFENEPLRQALDSLLRWEPAVKTIFHPGLRRWRFLNLYNGITRNVTINDFSGEYKVLGFELMRSIAGRSTAVRIVGPETLVQTTFDTDSGSLTEIPSGIVLETYSDGTGMHDVDAVNAWQITDPTLRRIGRLLTTPVVAETAGGPVETLRPLLEVSYDSGTTWYGIPWASINFHTGIVTTGGVYPHKDTVSALIPASTQTKFSPTDVRFTVCSYATPITVRAPLSGYSGTGYSVAGLTVEQWIYDEMLAVGYDPYGIPVTTLERTNAYQVIANLLLQQRSDIIYGGGMVLEGMQYDFVRLNSRVNIAATDGSGNAIVTGWESIGAFVTEAIYDYSEQTTTIQFSSDQLALAEFNPDFLRHRMGIKTLQLKQTLEIHPVFRTYMSKFSSHPMTEMSGVQYTIANSYIDPTNPNAPAQTPLQGHHANFRPDASGSQTPVVATNDQLERREAEPIVVNVTL